jgi:dolichyl-phosphate-mannose--protein O-mannosyl transferase
MDGFPSDRLVVTKRWPLSDAVDSKVSSAWLFLVLLLLGLFLHLFRLSDPPRVVFDEVHFGRFSNAYLGSHGYYFDIHPPHGKLLIAGTAYLGGYEGNQSFERINEPYENVSAALMRVIPALSGIGIPLLAFVVLMQLGASRWAAFGAGWMLAFDNGFLIQTRIIALDGFMVLSILAALAAGLRGLRGPLTLPRVLWTGTAGVFAGAAIGIKWTGLVGLGLLGLLILAELQAHRDLTTLKRSVLQSALILLCVVVVYVAGWAVHFAILDQPGPGDRWGAPTGEFLADFVHVHRKMWSANSGLDRGHPYASEWWTWPLMLRPISYWSSGSHHLHFLGNPFVWWGSTIGLIALVGVTILSRVSDLRIGDRVGWPAGLWILIAGYLGAFAPLMLVTRVLFLYHYLTPLVFAVCGLALWLDHLGWTRDGTWRDQRPTYWAALALGVVGFVLISPFTLPYVEASTYQSEVFRVFKSWL